MQLRATLMVFCLSLLLYPCSASSQSYPTIYVGLVSITPSNTPVLAGVDGGYFKKQGLEVKPLVLSGSSTALSAMLAGEVQMISIAGSGLINAHLAGGDAIMVAGTVNFAPYELIVAKEIKRLEDLRAKKMGIARFGGSADFLARWGLEKNGLKPGKDITILQTGGNPERLAAVNQGAIQATLLEQAFAHQAKKMGLRSLLDYSTIGLDYQHQGIGTTKRFIEKQHEVSVRFLKGMVEAIQRLKSDRAFGFKVIERHLRVSDAEVVQGAYDYYVPKIAAVPYANLKGMKFLLDTIAESNPKAKKAKAEDFVNTSLLKEIEASGFLKQISSGR
ncbi:MAG: ABC transporter substrate-binding protein [Deltaproteobacteria bacterium]|nr:ABC transporter substrate-binding protein [Deltaproteobacteria bacterium]